MRYLVFILLLLSVSAFADDYADSTTEMSNTVKQNLNFKTSSEILPDSVVFKYLQEGALVLSSAVSGKYFGDTIVTTAFDNTFAIDTAMTRVTRVVFFNKDTLLSLRYTPMESWRDLSINISLLGQTGKLSHPSRYDWDAGYIFLYPTPINADSFVVYGFSKITDIISDTTYSTQYPATYRPAIISYATMKVAKAIGRKDDANWWRDDFDRLVAILKGDKAKVSE